MADEQPRERRATDKWHVDKTINLPMIFAAFGIVLGGISWGNKIENGLTSEREARLRIEEAQDKERGARQQDRTELINSINQFRIEVNTQFREVKAEQRQELRDLRAIVTKATSQ